MGKLGSSQELNIRPDSEVSLAEFNRMHLYKLCASGHFLLSNHIETNCNEETEKHAVSILVASSYELNVSAAVVGVLLSTNGNFNVSCYKQAPRLVYKTLTSKDRR